jgi:hypothetical protein
MGFVSHQSRTAPEVNPSSAVLFRVEADVAPPKPCYGFGCAVRAGAALLEVVDVVDDVLPEPDDEVEGVPEPVRVEPCVYPRPLIRRGRSLGGRLPPLPCTTTIGP